jgi:hypothetical protein
MGGMGGMGGGHAQREQTRTQEGAQQRIRAGEGAHSASVPHENRYEFSKETRDRGVSRAGQ